MLDPIARAGIDRLYPDGLAGVRVLHLQCHFGSDTLSLANRGATVVGLDFSRPAVEEARRMADELDVDDRASFVEANVYDARHLLPEPESFDLVFTTWGTIGWLPDVAEWARIVAWFLKPGGRLYFADGHPAAFVFDGDGGPGGLPGFEFPYAKPERPSSRIPATTPTARHAIEHAKTWEWMHPLDEVMGALRGAGLSIDAFAEHYQVPWQIFPVTVPVGQGMFSWPAERWLPLSYELVASAPCRLSPWHGRPTRPRDIRIGVLSAPPRPSTLSLMSVVAQVLAVVEGLALVVVGILGAFFFRSRRLYGFFLIEPQAEEAVRPWAVYTGFTSMVWGIGVLAGVLAVNIGFADVGRTLVAFTSIAMVVLAFVILFTELRYWKNVIVLVGLPVLVLVAMVV